jgi:hypothetical protein
MMMKGPVRELLPSPPQHLRLTLPKGKRARSVQLLVAGTKPRFTEKGGIIELDVPPFELHEAVAVDLV